MPSVTATNKPPASAVSAFISAANTKSPREALAFEILHNLRYQHRWTDLKVHAIPKSTSTSTPSPSSSQENPNNRTQSPTQSDHLTPPTPPYSRKSPSQHDSALFLISGLPPHNLYIHPDLQKRLVRDGIDESSLQLQREWVLPLSIAEKWTLKRFCLVFDALPEREPVREPVRVYVAAQVVAESSERALGQVDNGDGSASGIAHQLTEGTDVSGVRGPDVDFTWHDRKRVLLAMLAHNGMGGDGTVAYYIMQEGEVKPRQNG